MKKVLLILCDGMRPDALKDIPQVEKLKQKTTHTLSAKTVFPSVTLPCHVSLFHSVDPTRHGTTTNVYAPQVRPINGLAEVLKTAGKKCAMFFSWEQLKDITRPGSLEHSFFIKDYEDISKTNQKMTDYALSYIKEDAPDFAFLYYHAPDRAGHSHGWMSEKYLQTVKELWAYIDRVIDSLQDEYTIIVTADHGGHDRIHGHDIPEDTTIPLFMLGEGFEGGKTIENANIIDLAPTIVKIMGVEKDSDWEGKSLL
jgi:predicted AlkP superfamily pyrophosphatase or phosphodiesterase